LLQYQFHGQGIHIILFFLSSETTRHYKIEELRSTNLRKIAAESKVDKV
jgi:hypothetical protein